MPMSWRFSRRSLMIPRCFLSICSQKSRSTASSSRIWNSVDANAFPSFRLEQSKAILALQTLTPKPRQAFLLLSLEGFDAEAIAEILDTDAADVAMLVATADHEISNQLEPADILIIEDEPLTAAHLQDLVTAAGHTVTGIARTQRQALKLAQETKPDLILSDIQLADGTPA